MTDDAALLSAVVAHPDDDLPRLVYADFLDERGDADRAEFIRVQCELASTAADDPRRPALAAREKELLAANMPRWVAPGLGRQQEFRRGFVEFIHVDAERLLEAAGVLSVVPLRGLRLVNVDRRPDGVFRLPVMARLESLDLRNNSIGNERLAGLLATADLPRLRSLNLRNSHLWPWGLEALVGVPAVARLTRLDLSGNPIRDVGLGLLAEEPVFAGLRELVVPSNDLRFDDCVHGSGASRLAESRTLTRLRVLDLGQHYIGDAGLIALAGSPNAAGLEELDVSANEIGAVGEGGIEALVESPHLARLRLLRLGDQTRTDHPNTIDRRAASALANWPRLRDGLTVDLRGCEMAPATRRVLAASPWADRFRLDPPDPEDDA